LISIHPASCSEGGRLREGAWSWPQTALPESAVMILVKPAWLQSRITSAMRAAENRLRNTAKKCQVMMIRLVARSIWQVMSEAR